MGLQASWYKKNGEETYVELLSSVAHPITGEVIVSLRTLTEDAVSDKPVSLLKPDFDANYSQATEEDLAQVLYYTIDCEYCDSAQPRGYFRTKEDALKSIENENWCYCCQETLSKYSITKTDFMNLKPLAARWMARFNKD